MAMLYVKLLSPVRNIKDRIFRVLATRGESIIVASKSNDTVLTLQLSEKGRTYNDFSFK